MTESIKVPKWPIKLSGLVLLATVLGAFAWVNVSFIRQTDAVNEFQRLPSMSGGTVEVEEAGTYTIWAGAACSGLCRPDRAEAFHENMVVQFVGGDGEVVVPRPKHDGQHYMLGAGREGRAVWLVDFDETGTFAMERRRYAGVGSSILWLGKGDGLPAGVMSGVVVISVVGGITSAGLLVYGWQRRKRAVDQMVEGLVGIH